MLKQERDACSYSVGSFTVIRRLSCPCPAACGIFVPWPRIEHPFPTLEGIQDPLTTGLPGKCQSLSHVRFSGNLWTVSHQALLSMEFNTGVGCHFLPQGIFLTQGSNPGFLHWEADLNHWTTREVPVFYYLFTKSSSPLLSKLGTNGKHTGNKHSTNVFELVDG